jgi:putative DNA primase/helicase
MDTTGEVIRRAKYTVLAIYDELSAVLDDDERGKLSKHAKHSEAGSRIREIVTLAESEASISITADRFDRDPMLFNVQNGTIDLRSGILHPHRREDFIGKISPYPYDPTATAPRFDHFLRQVFEGNEDVISFVKRALGYMLTGETGEHCLFFCHGSGRNGKSTLMDIISSVMGEYAKGTNPETLMVKGQGAATNDIAALAGARFVPTSEITDGRRFAENVVKQLTGGDRVQARFLYSEFFEFTPAFKIWLSANHKPGVTGTDLAIWERIKLIPFNVTIPEKQRDRDLGKRLRGEGAGILRFIVEGCLEWQSTGLAVPDEVRQATAEYRAEMDVLAGFIDECCVVNPRASVGATPLFEAFKQWADRSGEHQWTQRRFGTSLGERGFVQGREPTKTKRHIWKGIGLLHDGGTDGTDGNRSKGDFPHIPLTKDTFPDKGSNGLHGFPEAVEEQSEYPF